MKRKTMKRKLHKHKKRKKSTKHTKRATGGNVILQNSLRPPRGTSIDDVLQELYPLSKKSLKYFLENLKPEKNLEFRKILEKIKQKFRNSPSGKIDIEKMEGGKLVLEFAELLRKRIGHLVKKNSLMGGARAPRTENPFIMLAIFILMAGGSFFTVFLFVDNVVCDSNEECTETIMNDIFEIFKFIGWIFQLFIGDGEYIDL